ncbi:MAG: amidase [Anaerolineaceae bacterium]|nr:amidase [Anaerolineaceae bacterium]
MESIIYASVRTLAQAIRQKEVTAYEVVEAYLRRIEAVNPRLNAVVQLVADTALAQARAADDALARGERVGRLHGVPMTIKDSFDTAGVISTAGTLGRAHFVPDNDAMVVARLKAEGAILMGKTNTSELTLSFDPDNLVYGRTNNPYDLTRSPGGSSGGAAAIVASGGSPFDIGSDYGGSIRLPAHFCGVAGIKPTSGRVPRTGHIIPYAAGATDAYQQVGPLCRTVDDLALIMSIIAGPDWQDPAIVPMPWQDPQTVDLKRLRIAFHTDNGAMTPTAETIQTVRAVARSLESEVALLEEKCPPEIENTWAIWESVARVAGGQAYLNVIRQAGTDQISPNVQYITDMPTIPSDEFEKRMVALDHFRSRMLAFMQDYDVIICPANANVALKVGEYAQNRAGYTYTATYNVTGWPGVVVRAGTSPEGLPIGVQVIARPWREDVALAVAQFVESTFGGWQPPEL